MKSILSEMRTTTCLVLILTMLLAMAGRAVSEMAADFVAAARWQVVKR